MRGESSRRRRWGSGAMEVGRWCELMRPEIIRPFPIAIQTHLLQGLLWMCFLLGTEILDAIGLHINVNATVHVR